jgi:hypothetical protein
MMFICWSDKLISAYLVRLTDILHMTMSFPSYFTKIHYHSMTVPYSSTRAWDEKYITILVCKAECERPLRRTRRRREDNIKIAPKERVHTYVG